jgi:hypothetical protein
VAAEEATMAKKQRKAARRWPNETIPRQFRLGQETLEELDRIAEHIKQDTGVPASRADAIRYAARATIKALGINPRKD